MSKPIKLVPVTGKYVSLAVNSKTYEVWRVNPSTGEEGTQFEHDIAITLLKVNPPQVAILPEQGKDGKLIPVLTDEEKAEIKAAHVVTSVQFRDYSSKGNEVGLTQPSATTDPAITALLKEQASALRQAMTTITEQAEKLKAMSSQLEEFKSIVSNAETTETPVETPTDSPLTPVSEAKLASATKGKNK